MKSRIFKLVALIALLTGGLSCTDDCDYPAGTINVTNPEKKSSSFAIDNNIISFAAPYVACIFMNEHPSRPDYGSPEGFSPHFWTIVLLMAEGTDFTKLAPTVTLAPGAKITEIANAQGPKPVDYTGIANVGATDFSQQVDFTVIAPDGSTVAYLFLAVAVNDYGS